MRMVYCTCNISVLKRVQNMCEEVGVKAYQIIDRVQVKNREGDHRFNDAVWPGYNAILLFQFVDEELCQRLLDVLQHYNDIVGNVNERLVVCSWPMDFHIT